MPINSFLYPSKNVPVSYEIANSCRFNGADSAYFSKTPSSNGSQTISTFSAWIKKAVNGSYEGIFTSVYETGEYFEINFEPSDKLEIRSKYSNSYVLRKQTTRVFRDLSSWMHIVVILDTTNGTAEDRCKVYINGVRETSFSTNTNPGSSQNLGLNATSYEHRVGRDEWSTPAYFDGYMAEVHWIDGTAKAHTDFGEFDSDSPTIWIPKEYTDGGYGTNGFYLDFADSGNLGDDESGNTLDLAENNIVAADQATDTPTNNFCVMNPLDYTATTFSEGNLKLNWSQSPNVFGITTGTLFMGSGKYYFEAKITSPDSSTGIQVGVIQVEPYLSRLTAPGVDLSLFFGLGARFITTGGVHKVLNGTDSSISDSWSNNDIIRIAYDGSAGKIYMWKGTSELTGQDISAGTSFNNGTLTSGTMVLPYTSFGDGGSGTKTAQVEWNFGGCPAFSISSGNSDANGYGNFEYSVPSGYYSLCTKNLAEFG